MQHLCSTISITEQGIHVHIWSCINQLWHFARLLALSWNLLVWLEQFIWNCYNLHLLEKWQDHSHQKTAEPHWAWWSFASDHCPRCYLWTFLPGGATHNFINTSVLEENKTNPCTGSRNKFTQERPLRASSLLLPTVSVWTLCARY